jgi:hypothetical protein
MRACRSRSFGLFVVFLLAAAVPASAAAQGDYPPNGPTVAPVPLNGSAAPPFPTPKSVQPEITKLGE